MKVMRPLELFVLFFLIVYQSFMDLLDYIFFLQYFSGHSMFCSYIMDDTFLWCDICMYILATSETHFNENEYPLYILFTPMCKYFQLINTTQYIFFSSFYFLENIYYQFDHLILSCKSNLSKYSQMYIWGLLLIY